MRPPRWACRPLPGGGDVCSGWPSLAASPRLVARLGWWACDVKKEGGKLTSELKDLGQMLNMMGKAMALMDRHMMRQNGLNPSMVSKDASKLSSVSLAPRKKMNWMHRIP